jgi:hypothetical protein
MTSRNRDSAGSPTRCGPSLCAHGESAIDSIVSVRGDFCDKPSGFCEIIGFKKSLHRSLANRTVIPFRSASRASNAENDSNVPLFNRHT